MVTYVLVGVDNREGDRDAIALSTRLVCDVGELTSPTAGRLLAGGESDLAHGDASVSAHGVSRVPLSLPEESPTVNVEWGRLLRNRTKA